MLWGEVVCLDPLEWLRAGLVTNPGIFVLGQPGVGKIHHRQTPHHRHGRQRHPHPHPRRHQTRLHPTRALPRRAGHPRRPRPGPNQPSRHRTPRRRPAPHDRRPTPRQLRLEIRGRRMALLLALCALVRGRGSPTAKRSSWAGPSTCSPTTTADPTVPDVLHLIETGPRADAAAAGPHRRRVPPPRRRAHPHPRPALRRLPRRGVRRPHQPPDRPHAPAVSVDISRVAAAGEPTRRRGHALRVVLRLRPC